MRRATSLPVPVAVRETFESPRKGSAEQRQRNRAGLPAGRWRPIRNGLPAPVFYDPAARRRDPGLIAALDAACEEETA